MNPIISLLKIEPTETIQTQLINQFQQLIRNGILSSGQKLPSSRFLADELKIHRQTVVKIYEDLVLQGWLSSVAGKGTFISDTLPEINPQAFSKQPKQRIKAGFEFSPKPFIVRPVVKSSSSLHLDDGFPDPRLAPLSELSRAYKTNISKGNLYQKLGYGDTKGVIALRSELALYLNKTRGLNIGAENILIVRGTVMGFYLSNMAFVNPNDNVAVGQMSWQSGKIGFQQAGANLIEIPTDEGGMCIEVLEEVCKKMPLRMVYVTPHHDYPTTVIMKADRRLKLLDLAKKYRFIIFEDDYDYDFHYQSKPLLPLASADSEGLVLYSGSFTKSISPAFRVGYLVGPTEAIDHLAFHRRIIDRQGDNMLEMAVADILKDGTLERFLRKSLKTYRERRGIFSELLDTHLSDFVKYDLPEGGMSIWTKFDTKINLLATALLAFKNGLYISDGSQFDSPQLQPNATRLGFASSNESQLEQSVEILKRSLVFKK
jgi:GntR family transcriptional regulator / MocR family aminotransferase